MSGPMTRRAKEVNLFNVLPEHLREEVFQCQAAHHMAVLPVMHSFRRSQRVRLAASAETCDFMPGEAVASFLEIAKGYRGNKEHIDPVRARRPELKRSFSAISDDHRSENASALRATVTVGRLRALQLCHRAVAQDLRRNGDGDGAMSAPSGHRPPLGTTLTGTVKSYSNDVDHDVYFARESLQDGLRREHCETVAVVKRCAWANPAAADVALLELAAGDAAAAAAAAAVPVAAVAAAVPAVAVAAAEDAEDVELRASVNCRASSVASMQRLFELRLFRIFPI
eukprot:Skav236823  [mRNA]  locus=scaffold3481:6334:10967:- [translate_table: standard]